MSDGVYDKELFFTQYERTHHSDTSERGHFAIGCGFGDFLSHAIEHGAVQATGIDDSVRMIDHARSHTTSPRRQAPVLRRAPAVQCRSSQLDSQTFSSPAFRRPRMCGPKGGVVSTSTRREALMRMGTTSAVLALVAGVLAAGAGPAVADSRREARVSTHEFAALGA
ncbi:hypothetical protein [Streptomyces sp. NPDC102360]|uniref:hypothetical protein n=1 Tax=Streptomyces sp. NPDC102360 TaxID=3366160 RepID=UPI003813122D